MVASLGSSPGTERHPGHRVVVSSSGARWTAVLGGRRLADSNRALIVSETGHDPVVYFPPDTVNYALIFESESRTNCPFKGEAHYFAADVEGRPCDIAWYYPRVYDEVAKICGHVAFYEHLVTISSEKRDAQ